MTRWLAGMARAILILAMAWSLSAEDVAEISVESIGVPTYPPGLVAYAIELQVNAILEIAPDGDVVAIYMREKRILSSPAPVDMGIIVEVIRSKILRQFAEWKFSAQNQNSDQATSGIRTVSADLEYTFAPESRKRCYDPRKCTQSFSVELARGQLRLRVQAVRPSAIVD